MDTPGGWITDVASWRWVFYINAPVGIAALLIVMLGMPWTRPEGGKRASLDLLGSVLLVNAIVPLLLALTWGGDR